MHPMTTTQVLAVHHHSAVRPLHSETTTVTTMVCPVLSHETVGTRATKRRITKLIVRLIVRATTAQI